MKIIFSRPLIHVHGGVTYPEKTKVSFEFDDNSEIEKYKKISDEVYNLITRMDIL